MPLLVVLVNGSQILRMFYHKALDIVCISGLGRVCDCVVPENPLSSPKCPEKLV